MTPMVNTFFNKLIYAVVSGQAFFFGAGVAAFGLAVEALLARRRDRLGQRIAALAVLLGAFLIALSSAPLPVWFYGLGILALLAYLLFLSRSPKHGWRQATRVVMAVMVVVGVVCEAPHHTLRPVRGRPQRTVYVLGDSVSAGLGQPSVVPYPELLQRQHGARVSNLAVSGCTVQGAMSTLGQVRDPSGLVLIEIGGIDLFANRSPADFRRELEELLRRAAMPQRTVVMLELPLPPFAWSYGRAQRCLARDYSVILVPKRVMASVLCTPGATDPTDRIHLTRSGQVLMAKRLWPWLRPNIVGDDR